MPFDIQNVNLGALLEDVGAEINSGFPTRMEVVQTTEYAKPACEPVARLPNRVLNDAAGSGDNLRFNHGSLRHGGGENGDGTSVPPPP